MSNEFKDKMLQLLTQVDDVKATEAALQSERKRHQDQIAQSEADLKRTEDEIAQCRETALGLRRQMDDFKDEIFARQDEEVTLADDGPRTTEADDGLSPASAAKKLWDERARHLKQVQ
jgi:peptidoglycan hydrolase CwlO-like protein